MANIKSQKKRILIGERNRATHAAEKSEMRTVIKKVNAAVAAKDAEEAKALLLSLTYSLVQLEGFTTKT